MQTDKCIFKNKNLLKNVYVDDRIISSNLISDIIKFKEMISRKFKRKDLGELKFILGIRVERRRDGVLLLNQKQYVDKLIKKFNQISKNQISYIKLIQQV